MTRVITWLVLGFILLPSVVIVLMSFTEAAFVSFPPQGFTLRWYLLAAQKPEFIASVKLSMIVAAIVAVASASLGTAASILLRSLSSRAQAPVLALIMSPLVLPSVVIGISMINYFSLIGLGASPFAIIIGHVVVTTPYVVRLVSDSLASLPQNLEWAGASLGAPSWRVFSLIVLPNIRGGVIGGGLFAFIMSFENVTLSAFLATPGMTTLPVLIFGYSDQALEPWLVAICSVTVLLTTGLVMLLERTVGLQRVFTAKG